ncbi:alpha-(1-_3)-arabinofuranosyltransferase domain-containing protein [Baekduia sp. Peel2402]|uniref:alpha-(1->3)-arabinofuranosyltransferase domain-containing protein n=1 Tax=Baekduia sp. Peel2402 TaxID=3458296 RepID=UPI00403EABEF
MRRRPVVLPVALAALSYVLALVQRPGEVVADTKVHLYLDPSRFLRDVLSLWSSSPDLGHVWASQYGGYAWPMAPWFAAGDALGLPVWLVHRLWLGTIFFVAAWGVVRLLDALLSRERGVVHVVAAALYVVNPYVTVYADRASVTLLAAAALPWLLLATHRALREPRGWRWPIVFALVMATAGGGVNAATTAWVLVGPVLLVLYEVVWCGVRWRGVVTPVLARVVPLALVANLWWLIPLLLSGRGAPNFLVFTEQPGTIWSTTSLPESLRLMGFWTSYVGVGYGGVLRPYQGSAPAMLMLLPVVLAGLTWPAVALGTFTWTRRWRYAPFFLVLLLVGVLVMVAGWPEGTPLRTVITGAYYRVDSLQPLRTTYKAGALVALSLAVLCAAAAGVAWARWPRVLVGGAVAVVAVLAAWPLVTGRAIERQLAFDVPSAWHEAAADLSREPDDSRAMILPGQLFASYQWGGTVDAVLPALTDHPVTTRWIVPFADLRSTELQFTVDNLVTQERLRPGQLSPLLDLMGVGDVLVASDGDRSRSGEMTVAAAKRELASQLPSTGVRTYSSTLKKIPVKTGGLVRVLPRDPLTVVDGAAGGLAALASFGALNPDQAYAYAPDTDVRAAAGRGAAFVISDTNRRRAFVAARLKGAVGPTLPRDEGVSVDGTILDPFGDLDQRVQTTAEIGGGIAKVTAPASPQVTQLPEQRPFAAVDGNPATAWIADRALVPARHTLTVEFPRPRDVETLRLLPYSDSRGVVKAVTVNGRRYDVRRGWNTLRVGLRGVRSVEVHLAKVTKPKVAHAGAGGIRELEIPDVQATETLRPPTDVEDALRGTDLSHNALTYMLDRTTTDVPLTQQKVVGERGAGAVRDAQDPEPVLRRVIRPPAAREYAVDGWGSVSADLPDTVFARLSDSPDDADFTSSSRFEGLGRNRASGAFDGAGGRAWIGQWVPGHAAWIAWSTDVATTVRTLHLTRPSIRVRVPTRVRLTVDGTASAPLPVGRDGTVTLPAPLRGRVFRLDVLAARFPAGTPAQTKQRRAVGIGEITGDGIPTASIPRTGRVSLPCGIATATVGATTYRLRATADRAALDAGRPIRLTGCGTLDVPARDTTIIGSTSALRVDALRLDSTAPAPAKRAGGGGTVIDAGEDDHGGRTGVKLDVAGPSYLLLGQSYDKNWRATCDGRDLGTPQPLQGYANAWPVDKGCTDVSFSFAPQKLADIGYLISGVGCAVLLAALGLFAFRRRRTAATPHAPDPGPASLADPPPATPRTPLAALAIALPSAVLVAGVFGLRAGAVAAPLLALIFWRGLSDRTLGFAVLGLLGVVVPGIYAGVAAFGDHDVLGGNSTRFSADRLAAHWVAVAAFVLLVVVLVRTLAAARRRDRLPSAP